MTNKALIKALRHDVEYLNNEVAKKDGQLMEAYHEVARRKKENVEKLCSERRETLIALDRLEEAQFWAIKGISRETHAE